MTSCNICGAPDAKFYGSDPHEPDYEYWYCNKCIGYVITPNGEGLAEVKD